MRGVFFDYAMVWRSTFIRDPESAARALRVVLGPAAARARMAAARRERCGSHDGRGGRSGCAVDRALGDDGAALRGAPAHAARAARRRCAPRAGSPRIRDAARRAVLRVAARGRAQDPDRAHRVRDRRRRAARDRETRRRGRRLRLRTPLRRAPGSERCAASATPAAACRHSRRSSKPSARRSSPSWKRSSRARAPTSRWRSPRPSSARSDAPSASGPTARSRSRASDLSRGSPGGLGTSLGRELGTAVGAAVTAGVSLVVATISGGFGHHLGAAILVGAAAHDRSGRVPDRRSRRPRRRRGGLVHGSRAARAADEGMEPAATGRAHRAPRRRPRDALPSRAANSAAAPSASDSTPNSVRWCRASQRRSGRSCAPRCRFRRVEPLEEARSAGELMSSSPSLWASGRSACRTAPSCWSSISSGAT